MIVYYTGTEGNFTTITTNITNCSVRKASYLAMLQINHHHKIITDSRCIICVITGLKANAFYAVFKLCSFGAIFKLVQLVPKVKKKNLHLLIQNQIKATYINLTASNTISSQLIKIQVCLGKTSFCSVNDGTIYYDCYVSPSMSLMVYSFFCTAQILKKESKGQRNNDKCCE